MSACIAEIEILGQNWWSKTRLQEATAKILQWTEIGNSNERRNKPESMDAFQANADKFEQTKAISFQRPFAKYQRATADLHST